MQDNTVIEGPFPTLDELLKTHPGYLDEAVDPDEASRVLGGTSVDTLSTWRSRGGGPTFLRLGRRIKYRRRALFEFMAARERRSTSDAPGNTDTGTILSTKVLAVTEKKKTPEKVGGNPKKRPQPNQAEAA